MRRVGVVWVVMFFISLFLKGPGIANSEELANSSGKAIEVLYFSQDMTKVFLFEASLSGKLKVCTTLCDESEKSWALAMKNLRGEIVRIKLEEAGAPFKYANPEGGEGAVKFLCLPVRQPPQALPQQPQN